METHAAFIDALGGGTKVADLLTAQTGTEVDRERVYKWKTIGVPPKWQPNMAALARDKNVQIPPDFFEPVEAAQ